jgi:DNA primase
LNIKVIEVPEGKDPADLVKSDPKKWINACKKAKYVVDYIFDSTFEKYNLANILDKKRVTRELLATISRLPDPVEKEHYLQILSSRVGVSLRALTDALRKAKSTTPTRNVGTPTESVEEAKPKPRSLEEHVISLLLATPNFADFFFNKLRPADFIEPRLIGFADELSKMKEKSGEIDLATWQKNQSKEDQAYIKNLILRVEDEFGELNEEKLGEEIFNSVLRLRHNNFSRAKKDLSSQIQAVEKSGDKEKLKKMMTEFQKLVERERNV